MDLQLNDKVAVVTGSSRGIGLAISHALAAEKCRVTLCARTEQRLREAASEVTTTAGGPVPADADPERLAQAVANLVENALKYARAAVTVEVDRSAAGVEIRVGDDGPGIPAAERGRVFERLYTARPAHGRPVGTGIGLAIVSELAQAMGGSARCDAIDGAGARFTLTLPT